MRNTLFTPAAPLRLAIVLAIVLPIVLAGCISSRQYYPTADPSLPFSNAVLLGDTLHVAGHLGLHPDTNLPPADPAEEARLLLDAFTTTLARAGMTMEDLLAVQVFCSDVLLYDTFNTEYRRRFHTTRFPARAFVGSGPLLRGCRFEIAGTAVRR